MKFLILGVDGMLGHVLFAEASKYGEVRGTSRRLRHASGKVVCGVEAFDLKRIETIIQEYKPEVVINCIGIIKQLDAAKDPTLSLKINSLLPHELSHLIQKYQSRLIHFSTDCVFKGDKGNYSDSAESDAIDLYGRTKYLGEVGGDRCLTLRTSIIGHELDSNRSLVDWFLTQKDKCKGYKGAIYSGFPTIVMADVLFKKVIPANLSGIYNLSSNPISKYDLLKLIAKTYRKKIIVEADETFKIDRSLDSGLLQGKLQFSPDPWEMMVQKMHQHFVSFGYLKFKKDYDFETL